MLVALYDVDSKIPNLALMKVSRFHKDAGDEVVLYDPLWKDTYDKIYASKIFLFSDDSTLDAGRMEIGGTGWDVKSKLPPEIESGRPDYSLYGYPHNIGFTMRGCRFRCKFCVVPEKEGKPYVENTIDYIWQQRDSDFIMLLDNDFFGNPEWQARIDEIKANNLRVCFSQGLNIRIITDEQADALASVNFRDVKNKTKRVFFAWDQWGKGTERVIMEGINRVVGAGLKPYQMAFYVLIGFNTTPDQDVYRVEKLRDLGCDPYVMPYDKEDPYQKAFARWVNHKAIFKSVPWEDYSSGGWKPEQAKKYKELMDNY
tara:strand:+ start:840 stop:1781 length:942 start_codon:yes stop_codon:yes gene_type:complete